MRILNVTFLRWYDLKDEVIKIKISALLGDGRDFNINLAGESGKKEDDTFEHRAVGEALKALGNELCKV
jgi:hypothetical protein